MPLEVTALCSPLGPLRRDTFRDKSDADFSLRVAHILAKAQRIVDGKAPTALPVAKEPVVEALALGMAYETAASIHAALAIEEGVSGEVDLKYTGPAQLRKESERYLEKYAALLAALLEEKTAGPVRSRSPPKASLMGVGLPAHLSATHQLALRRSGGGGLTAWKSPQGDIPPYWTGEGYVSFPCSEAVATVEGRRRTGHALFYFEAQGGEFPKASDKLLVDDVELEVIAVRPANSLIDYWKIDLKTGTS